MYKRLHVSGIAPAKRGVPVLLHVFAVEIISIHAPCGGGRAAGRGGGRSQQISIHAPVWGRACLTAVLWCSCITFQFTPPCGGGRPRWRRRSTRSHAYFNSRPRVGAGAALIRKAIFPAKFQFTPPCGGGRGDPGEERGRAQFQFTPPCGGGPRGVQSGAEMVCISIHAPVWGRAG